MLFTRDVKRGLCAVNFCLIFVETHSKTFNRTTVDEFAAAVTDEGALSGRHL